MVALAGRILACGGSLLPWAGVACGPKRRKATGGAEGSQQGAAALRRSVRKSLLLPSFMCCSPSPAAGLCHDLGHGPFSHVFEREFLPRRGKKEWWANGEGKGGLVPYGMAESACNGGRGGTCTPDRPRAASSAGKQRSSDTSPRTGVPLRGGCYHRVMHVLHRPHSDGRTLGSQHSARLWEDGHGTYAYWACLLSPLAHLPPVRCPASASLLPQNPHSSPRTLPLRAP